MDFIWNKLCILNKQIQISYFNKEELEDKQQINFSENNSNNKPIKKKFIAIY